MPEIPQQIFGASIETVTSSSAVITWSTTVSDSTSIQFALANVQPVNSSVNRVETSSGTDHAVTLTELDVGTAYWVFIRADDAVDIILYFNTSTVVDETAPELLNLDAEVLEDGRIQVTWYTSESATEEVLIGTTSIHEDAFATKKNHQFVTEPYANGDYSITVRSADASGNMNESSISITIAVEGGDGNTNPTSPNDSTNQTDEDDKSSPMSGGIVQIGLLITVLVLLVAFVRVRNGQDGDDKWN
jgi:hypothetical protein